MIKANKNWVHLKTTYTDDVIDGVPAWMIFKNATGWIGEKKVNPFQHWISALNHCLEAAWKEMGGDC